MQTSRGSTLWAHRTATGDSPEATKIGFVYLKSNKKNWQERREHMEEG